MTKFFNHIFLLIALSVAINSFSQSTNGKLYVLDNDEAEKPKILTLLQTSNGLILCGTSKGLYRFDGFDFSLYPEQSKINAAITAIFETTDKRILLGYDNGNLAELYYNSIHLLNFEEGFPKVPIKSITEDPAGIIWIGTAGEGIYYVKANKLYNINEDDGLSDNYIYKLVYLPKRGIIATSDRGINICLLSNGKKNISSYTSKDGLPDNIVRSIYITNDQSIWLGMQDAGIRAYNVNFSNASPQTRWSFGQVNDLIVAASKVFVATEDSALVVFGYDKNKTLYKKTYIDHTIQKPACLLNDREGNIWVAGNNELLRIGKAGSEEVYKLSGQQAGQVHCLHYTSDSALWFNTPGGLTRLYKLNGEWRNEHFTLPGFANTTITALYEDLDDNLWVGSLGKGITVFNHERKTQRRLQDSSLINSNIISIAGKGNVIWISSLEGVVQATIANDKIKYVDYTDTAGIGNKYVYNILTDSKSRVWFATDGEGISVLDNGVFTHLKKKPGYIGNVVYKVLEDRSGNIWYATFDKGVVKYDGKTFTSYTTERGLSDAVISGLVNAGNYLAVIHKNSIDLINPVSGKISYIDKTQPSIEINTDLNACTNDKAGNIYFISNGIIYSFNLSSETVQQPVVNIDKIDLFLQNFELNKGHIFRHNQNTLSFFYTGIYYSQPERIQYQYKLDGYDKEWISTTDRVKNFANLPPGDYKFRVRASLNKNFANAAEASFSFVIDKPFWLQAWFIILASLLVAFLLYFLIRWRERQINKFNKLQNEKIQSQLETLRNQVNPHFLFNSFNILISEIENRPDNAVTYVEKLSDFYRNILTHRDKDLIPLKDELDILKDYMFLQEKRFSSGLEIDICVSRQTIDSTLIPPLVLQMLVENAIKHNIVSKESPLCIEIKETSEDCLAVSNNINKKVRPEKSSGLGLQNIRKRYALLHVKEIVIESDDKCFTVKIPLLKKQYDKDFNPRR
jgi:ligand-binding sensor domain-containing protein